MSFEGEFGMFSHVERVHVIQEFSCFHESSLSVRRASNCLTRLLYLLMHGEVIPTKEATTAFFAAIKAFQSRDANLRRLLYLTIKELSGMASDVIMVTSSLQQDFNNTKQPEIAALRPNALRVMGQVIEPSMVPALERFLKQALLDPNRSTCGAALCTALHWHETAAPSGANQAREAVRRWAPEVQQALQSGAARQPCTAQAHAIALLALIRQSDRIALGKLVQGQLSQAAHLHPLTACTILRIQGLLANARGKNLVTILESFDAKPMLRWRGRSDAVALEAARLICAHPEICGEADVLMAVACLQTFLSSPKPLLRFASLRTLADLARRQPQMLTACVSELELLVVDSHRGIAAMALTALLRVTNSEGGVDRLLSQLGHASSPLGELAEEQRLLVVEAVRLLAQRFPAKQPALLDFLGSALKETSTNDQGSSVHQEGEEGDLTPPAYRLALVEAIGTLLSVAPDAAFGHLCELVEDCSSTELVVRVVHLLGEQGKLSRHPTRLVRCLHNRLILEGSRVRCATVGALGTLARTVPSLRPSIEAILRSRALRDPDDDTRDRAVAVLQDLKKPSAAAEEDQLVWDLDALQNRLLDYLADPNAAPLDLQSVPKITVDELFERQVSLHSQHLQQQHQQLQTKSPTTASQSANQASVEAVNPFIEQFGPVFSHGPMQALTEAETEYVVEGRVHMHESGHLVFQFEVRNTVQEQVLEQVQVALRPDPTLAGLLRPVGAISIARLAPGEVESCWVAYQIVPGIINRFEGSLAGQLRFRAQEIDPETGQPLGPTMPDQYSLEPVQVRSLADWVANVPPGKSLGHEQTETFALTAIGSLGEAVAALCDLIGGRVQQGGASIPVSATQHQLVIGGSLWQEGDGKRVAADAFTVSMRLALMPTGGVSLEMTVNSESDECTQAIIGSIA